VLPAEGSAGERLARALYGLQVRLGRAGHLLGSKIKLFSAEGNAPTADSVRSGEKVWVG
jgi:hypothetical protein